MANKLTALCELQLYSILQEIGTSGVETTSAATRALANCTRLEEVLNECAQNESSREALDAVTKEVNNVIINLQFMDELSQRVGHVLQLFSILKRSMPARVDDKENDEEFLKIATRIFSMQAEFAVLQQLFPGCNHVSCSNDTELF
jgi:two-component sensor histidine kinase